MLDEHAVAALRSDDAEYDEKFLAAMNIARQRPALFEAEDGAQVYPREDPAACALRATRDCCKLIWRLDCPPIR